MTNFKNTIKNYSLKDLKDLFYKVVILGNDFLKCNANIKDLQLKAKILKNEINNRYR